MKSFKDYMLDEAANKKKAPKKGPKVDAKEKARRAEMDSREPGLTDADRERVSQMHEENIEETMDEPGPTRYRKTKETMAVFNKAIASDNKKYGTNPDTKANDKKRAIGLQKKVTSIGKTHDNSASVQRNRKELERLKAKAAARTNINAEFVDEAAGTQPAGYLSKLSADDKARREAPEKARKEKAAAYAAGAPDREKKFADTMAKRKADGYKGAGYAEPGILTKLDKEREAKRAAKQAPAKKTTSEEVEPIEESQLPRGYRDNRRALSHEAQKPEATKASLAGLQSSWANRQKRAALAKSQKSQPLSQPSRLVSDMSKETTPLDEKIGDYRDNSRYHRADLKTRTPEVRAAVKKNAENKTKLKLGAQDQKNAYMKQWTSEETTVDEGKETYRETSKKARQAGHQVRRAAGPAGEAAARDVTKILLKGYGARKVSEELSPKEIMKKKSSGGSSSNDAAKTERKLGDAQNAAKRAAPGGADSPAAINAARGIDRLRAIRAKHGK
jgi:hypothetical protein